MFLNRQLEKNKKPLLSESYSLAGRDRQQRALPREQVIAIVFINLGR